MIEVKLIGSNFFTLVGQRLGSHPDSTVSIHTVMGPSEKDQEAEKETYEWEITLNVNARDGRPFPLYQDRLPRRGGAAAVVRKLELLLADFGVKEGFNKLEVMETCERLHKRWVRSEVGVATSSRIKSSNEEDLAAALSEPKVRWNLVAHLKEQIERDPVAYANDAKIRACLGKITADLNYAKAMDENDHGNHHNREQDDCPCYECQVRRGDRRP